MRDRATHARPVPYAPADRAGPDSRPSRSRPSGSRPSGATIVLHPSSARLLHWQLACIAALLLASVAVRVAVATLDVGPLLSRALLLLYVDRERAVPTFYAAAVIFACAALALLIARFELDVGVRRRGWTLLGVVIAWVGADELLAIHERSVEPVRAALGITGGALYYAWVVPALVLVCLLGVALFGFLRHLPGATRAGFLVAGTTFVVGAAGMEMIGAALVSGSSVDLYADESLTMLPLVTIEEGLEMLGMALFLTTLVAHVEREHPGAGLHVDFRRRRGRTDEAGSAAR